LLSLHTLCKQPRLCVGFGQSYTAQRPHRSDTEHACLFNVARLFVMRSELSCDMR
jgi:hypothetical protein